MSVRKLRLQKGWSQDQLAEFSGLSVRTIQRIERGQPAGLESLKSLAAAFDVELNTINGESDMPTNNHAATSHHLDEEAAILYVRDLKSFYTNLATYIFLIPCLWALNLYVSPGYLWIGWVIMGWGIGIVFHGLTVFEVTNLFGPGWEKKQIEKRLGRKL
jgi:transcriptional regulator with XRE-family HTH domain